MQFFLDLQNKNLFSFDSEDSDIRCTDWTPMMEALATAFPDWIEDLATKPVRFLDADDETRYDWLAVTRVALYYRLRDILRSEMSDARMPGLRDFDETFTERILAVAEAGGEVPFDLVGVMAGAMSPDLTRLVTEGVYQRAEKKHRHYFGSRFHNLRVVADMSDAVLQNVVRHCRLQIDQKGTTFSCAEFTHINELYALSRIAPERARAIRDSEEFQNAIRDPYHNVSSLFSVDDVPEFFDEYICRSSSLAVPEELAVSLANRGFRTLSPLCLERAKALCPEVVSMSAFEDVSPISMWTRCYGRAFDVDRIVRWANILENDFHYFSKRYRRDRPQDRRPIPIDWDCSVYCYGAKFANMLLRTKQRPSPKITKELNLGRVLASPDITDEQIQTIYNSKRLAYIFQADLTCLAVGMVRAHASDGEALAKDFFKHWKTPRTFDAFFFAVLNTLWERGKPGRETIRVIVARCSSLPELAEAKIDMYHLERVRFGYNTPEGRLLCDRCFHSTPQFPKFGYDDFLEHCSDEAWARRHEEAIIQGFASNWSFYGIERRERFLLDYAKFLLCDFRGRREYHWEHVVDSFYSRVYEFVQDTVCCSVDPDASQAVRSFLLGLSEDSPLRRLARFHYNLWCQLSDIESSSSLDHVIAVLEWFRGVVPDRDYAPQDRLTSYIVKYVVSPARDAKVASKLLQIADTCPWVMSVNSQILKRDCYWARLVVMALERSKRGRDEQHDDEPAGDERAAIRPCVCAH